MKFRLLSRWPDVAYVEANAEYGIKLSAQNEHLVSDIFTIDNRLSGFTPTNYSIFQLFSEYCRNTRDNEGTWSILEIGFLNFLKGNRVIYIIDRIVVFAPTS